MQGPNGVAYTRNGAFTTDAKGQLVTADAQPVLDDGGRPITVGNNATISPDGRVTVDGRQVAKLAVTALDPKRLHKLGDNLYTGTVVKNIGKASGAQPISTWGRPAYEIGRSSGAAR